PIGARPKNGQSSVARPEQHQKSQKLQPITAPLPVPEVVVPDVIVTPHVPVQSSVKRSSPRNVAIEKRKPHKSGTLGIWLILVGIVLLAGVFIYLLMNQMI